MKKTLKPLTFLFFALILTLVSLQTSIIPAFASPASSTYTSRPSANNGGFLLAVNNPANAHDNNTVSYADFVYSCTDSKKPSGNFSVYSFSTLANPWRIVKVDFYIKYSATVNVKGGTYTIKYYVGTASGTLVPATGLAHSVPGIGYDVWFNRAEPNDGVWSWTDIGNIRVAVESPFTRGETGTVNEYEVWAKVTYRRPTLYVDPTSLSANAPFTIDINITNMDDLYSWEFNVTYDTSILTATNVQEEPFLNSSGPTQFNKTISDANGWVYAYCSFIGDIPGVSGSGDLANITFSIDASGSSSLDLHNSKLVEYDYVAKKSYNYPPNHLAEVDGSVTATAPAPEFPLGAAMEIALVSVIIYVWWKSKREPKPLTSVHRRG